MSAELLETVARQYDEAEALTRGYANANRRAAAGPDYYTAMLALGGAGVGPQKIEDRAVFFQERIRELEAHANKLKSWADACRAGANAFRWLQAATPPGFPTREAVARQRCDLARADLAHVLGPRVYNLIPPWESMPAEVRAKQLKAADAIIALFVPWGTPQ